jgi:hypothetical protein
MGFSAQALGEAFLSSPLGASELIVGLLVATTFFAFAAKSLASHQGRHAWGRHEPFHR